MNVDRLRIERELGEVLGSMDLYFKDREAEERFVGHLASEIAGRELRRIKEAERLQEERTQRDVEWHRRWKEERQRIEEVCRKRPLGLAKLRQQKKESLRVQSAREKQPVPPRGSIFAHTGGWCWVDPALGFGAASWEHPLVDLIAASPNLESVVVRRGKTRAGEGGEIELSPSGDYGFRSEIRIDDDVGPDDVHWTIGHEFAHLVHAVRWGDRWAEAWRNREAAEAFAEGNVWRSSIWASSAVEMAPGPPEVA